MSRLIAVACSLVLVCLLAAPVLAAKSNLQFNTKLSVTTEDGTVLLPRNSKAGFRLDIAGPGGDPSFLYELGVYNSRANPGLDDNSYPFYLEVSSSTQTALKDYFDAKGWPSAWYPQIYGQIEGDLPFFYLESASDTYALIDAFKEWLGQTDPPLVLNDDYPLGTYVYQGTLTGSNDAELDVVITLTTY
jgi:hypothetical protein